MRVLQAAILSLLSAATLAASATQVCDNVSSISMLTGDPVVSMTIASNAFTASDGSTVAAGSALVSLTNSGSFCTYLYPNAGTSGLYTVVYRGFSGATYTENLNVNPAAGSVNLSMVRLPGSTLTSSAGGPGFLLPAGSNSSQNGGSNSGTSVALPPATMISLGGVKIGNGLNVGLDGTVSINAGALSGTFDPIGAASAAQAASLQKSNNLADLASPSTARTNLGLGSASTQPSSAFDASGSASAAQAAAIAAAAAAAPGLAPVQKVGGVSPAAGNVPLASTNLTDSASIVRSGSGTYAVKNSASGNIERDFPSVLDVAGVDPTGTTDSTTGILNMLQANLTGHIQLPAGRYKIQPITLIETQRISGSEGSSSILDCSAYMSPGACVTFASNTAGNSPINTNTGGGLSDIAIACYGNGNTGLAALALGSDPNGIYSASSNENASNLKFQNLVVHGCGYGVVYGNNTYSIDFIGLMDYGNQVGVYYPQGLTNAGEVTNFFGGNIHDNAVSGLDLNGGSWNFDGTRVDFNGPATAGYSDGGGPAITASGTKGGSGVNITGINMNLEQWTGRLVQVSPNQGAGYPMNFVCVFCTFGLDAPSYTMDDAMLYSSTFNFSPFIIGGQASTAGSGNSALHPLPDFLSMPAGGHVPRFPINPTLSAGIAAVSTIGTLGLFPSIITADATYGNLSNINNLGANGNGTFATGLSTTTGSISTGSHFVSTSSVTPSCGTGAGTGSTCNTSGSDVDGIFSVVTGSSPSASAAISTAVFQRVYGAAPHCQITPGNAAAAALSGTQTPYPTSTASQVQLNSNSSPLAASTAYVWTYSCTL